MDNYWSDLNIKVTYGKMRYLVGTVMCDISNNYCIEAVNFILFYVCSKSILLYVRDLRISHLNTQDWYRVYVLQYQA